MKKLSFLAVIALSLVSLLSCKKDAATGTPKPASGSTKTVVVDFAYVQGTIEGTNPPSYAIWPAAVFPVDANAVKYKVRFYHFTGTFSNAPENATYTWNKGELPPTPYSVYPSTKDIKDGKYYVCIGRTWCAGCTAVDPQWQVNYNTGYGTTVKAEITYTY